MRGVIYINSFVILPAPLSPLAPLALECCIPEPSHDRCINWFYIKLLTKLITELFRA